MTAPVPLPIGAAVLDPAARTLSGPGGTARLTPAPLRLLLCLAAVAPRVLPYPEAVAALGDRYGRAGPGTVHFHLRAVRRALRESGAGATAVTVYGIGARLDVPPRALSAEGRNAEAREAGDTPGGEAVVSPGEAA